MAIAKEIFDLSVIVPAMQAHWPSKKCNHTQVAIDYYQMVKNEITRGIVRADPDQIKLKLIPVNFKKMRDKSSRYGSAGQQKYWFDWFQSNFALMQIHQKGYSIGTRGTLTMIKFTKELEIMLADQDTANIFKSIYAEAIDSDVDFVPIDFKSLDNYIKHTSDQLLTLLSNDARQATLKANLKSAKLIKLIAEFCSGELPQIVNNSDFGRRYYRGPNLQSAAKIVRQAALGQCWSYDIEASVFAWKVDTAKEIDPKIGLPATLDYLQFKRKKRQHLAKVVFGNCSEHSIRTIKQAITAVGFGARTTNCVWRLENGQWKTSALKDLIYSNDALQRLFADAWFSEFVQEQTAITNLIFNEVKTHPAIASNKLLRSDRGLISKNRVISWLYQQTESKIIQALANVLEKHGQSMLLLCHDGFYTKQRAPVLELRRELLQHLPSARLEETYCTRFNYCPEADQFEQAHNIFIQQEEQRVAQLRGQPVHYPKPLELRKTYSVEDHFVDAADQEQAYQVPKYLESQLEFELLFGSQQFVS